MWWEKGRGEREKAFSVGREMMLTWGTCSTCSSISTRARKPFPLFCSVPDLATMRICTPHRPKSRWIQPLCTGRWGTALDSMWVTWKRMECRKRRPETKRCTQQRDEIKIQVEEIEGRKEKKKNSWKEDMWGVRRNVKDKCDKEKSGKSADLIHVRTALPWCTAVALSVLLSR